MAHEEKVTNMMLNVDLQCSKCCKKVKKVLCKFPQVRDQVYDEKTNKVLIKVVCCSPEKIRDKICYKGGGSIKKIEIIKLEKPKPAASKEEDKKKKDQETTKKTTPPKDKEAGQAAAAAKPPEKSAKPTNPDKPKQHQNPVQSAIPMYYPPMAMEYGGAGYATGVPAGHFCRGGAVQFDGYYGRPVYDSWGGYDNDQPGCSIM